MDAVEYVIRNYKTQDKLTVLNLLRLNTPKFFSEEEETDLIYYLDNEIEMYFVVENDSEIIGCGGINFTENKTIGKLSWDIIHPNFQKKGLGTLLLNHRISILKKKKGIKKIVVRTSQLAYKYYEKSNFRLVEEVKDYWAKGFDLYYMELKEEKDED